MMTREETIHALKEIKDYIESDDASLDCRKAVAGLDFAISALRPVSQEQVEKVWRGEWIDKRILSGAPSECSKCGYWVFENLQDMEFCPHCGTPMTDEAIRMMMERLEELHDTSN